VFRDAFFKAVDRVLSKEKWNDEGVLAGEYDLTLVRGKLCVSAKQLNLLIQEAFFELWDEIEKLLEGRG